VFIFSPSSKFSKSDTRYSWSWHNNVCYTDIRYSIGSG